MSEQRNLLLALVLSLGVLALWEFWFSPREAAEPPPPPEPPAAAETLAAPFEALSGAGGLGGAGRLRFGNDRLTGSLSLYDGRIDDLVLTSYHLTPDASSPAITLLQPGQFLAESFWHFADGGRLDLTGRWRGEAVSGRELLLTAESGALTITRRIRLDDDYMFTIEEEIVNRGEAVVMIPSARIARQGPVEISGYYLVHEGLIGVFSADGLEEVDYDDLAGGAPEGFQSQGGFLGITDKYWAAIAVPDKDEQVSARFSAREGGGDFIYQAEFAAGARRLAANGRARFSWRLFAGAKEVALIDRYEAQTGIEQFDLLIDWGWFYFLTKPLFLALDWLYRLAGNFGLAILLVTVIIKLIFFPLANMSYAALAAMRRIQPDVEALRTRYEDDPAARNQALMALYREKGVNPAAGCLPFLIQIPVFFAIYKVLFVTIEMRHAPFYGWINDLSAADPTSLLNLFGLLPFTVPDYMSIGLWPILMGLTMWVQMQLNPPPPDPIQRRIFAFMPLIITIALARFPAGLVIYWAWNNLLSVLQQAYIMHRHGAELALFANIARMLKKQDDKK